MNRDIMGVSEQQSANRPEAVENRTVCCPPPGSDDRGENIKSGAPAPAIGFKERRRSTRYQCSGSVEIEGDGSDVHLRGNLTDISLHGCYVEMPTTFPVETLLTLNIDVHGVHFRTRAKVRVTYPFLGMGMCFTETEPGQQQQLTQLLRAIAGQRASVLAHPSGQPGTPDIVASADAWAYLDAISSFFRNNTTLSRDEFFAIAKRVRRS
jgi:PilZ domain